jgi:hypothetical protein
VKNHAILCDIDRKTLYKKNYEKYKIHWKFPINRSIIKNCRPEADTTNFHTIFIYQNSKEGSEHCWGK